jgi:hypothetical protein
MAIQFKDLNDDVFTLDLNNDDMDIEVTVGDGQPFFSINVFLDQTLLGSGTKVPLGPASKLRGKRLVLVVVVQDRLEETNQTSFTSWITQRLNTKQYGPFNEEAKDNMDTVIYTLKINMQ